MSGAGAAVPLGSAEVSVNVNLGPLESGFNQAKRQTQQFEAATQRTANVVRGNFTRSLNEANQASVVFRQQMTRAASSISLIPGPAGVAASRVSSLLITMQSLGARGIAVGGTIALLGIVLSKGFTEAEKFERGTLRLKAALEATSYAAGVSADQINDFAEELEASTLATSDDIKEAAQALITFGSVSGEEFKRTIRLAQDLSSRFGGIVNATEALGRAYESPIQAARQFRRIGLHELIFQQAQAMQEAGKEAESYSFILDAISKKGKGLGEAEAKGAAGAWHRLTDASDDFFRTLGQNLGLLDAFASGMDLITIGIKGADSVLKTFAAGVKGLRELLEDPFAIDLPDFIGPDTTGIFLKGQAKAAAERKKADDAALMRLKAQQEATKAYKTEMEQLAKAEKDRLEQQEVQREQALENALLEVSVTERLTSELINSGRARSDITKVIQDQIAAEKELAALGLKSTDVDAGRIQSARLLKQINEDMLDAILSVDDENKKKAKEAAEQFIEGQLKVNEILREMEKLITDVGANTVVIGAPAQVQAVADFRARLMETIDELKAAKIETGLLEEQVDRLTQSFSDATSVNLSTQLLSELINQTSAFNLELKIQTETFGLTEGAAARFRSEQEALARQIKLTGTVEAEQWANIKLLANEYGIATQALADFQGKQDAARATSGLLSDALRDIESGVKSVGEAALDMALGLAEAVKQAALFGEGPFAQILGTSGTGGLFGGAINDLFGVGDAAAGGAEAGGAAALTTAATSLSTAVGALSGAAGGLTGAATGLTATATAFTAPITGLSTSGGLLSAAAGALSAAAAALAASAAASGAADAASGASDAASSFGSIHTGRAAFSTRPSPSRRVPVRAFINAPRFHRGLRQGEFPAILEDGEEVTSRADVKKRRRGGDTYNMSFPGVQGNADTFRSSQPQVQASLADAMYVAKRRNR